MKRVAGTVIDDTHGHAITRAHFYDTIGWWKVTLLRTELTSSTVWQKGIEMKPFC